MWLRRAALRPIPSFARIPGHALEAVRQSFADDDTQAKADLDGAFQQFEETQPALADHVAQILGKPMDETALALGYFLTLAIWLAFENTHDDALGEVSDHDVTAAVELLKLDEQLRLSDPNEPLESDDIISMDQPELMLFIHEHVDATLETHADHVDVDDVSVIYRLVLAEVLALSYAVRRPDGFPVTRLELMA